MLSFLVQFFLLDFDSVVYSPKPVLLLLLLLLLFLLLLLLLSSLLLLLLCMYLCFVYDTLPGPSHGPKEMCNIRDCVLLERENSSEYVGGAK
jgi:hypothetical protein